MIATIPVLLRTVRNNFIKRLNQCIAIKFTSFEWHNFGEKLNSIHLNLRMRIMFLNGNKNVFVAYVLVNSQISCGPTTWLKSTEIWTQQPSLPILVYIIERSIV